MGEWIAEYDLEVMYYSRGPQSRLSNLNGEQISLYLYMPGIAWLGVACGIGGWLALQTVDEAAQGNKIFKGTVSKDCCRRESQGKKIGIRKKSIEKFFV